MQICLVEALWVRACSVRSSVFRELLWIMNRICIIQIDKQPLCHSIQRLKRAVSTCQVGWSAKSSSIRSTENAWCKKILYSLCFFRKVTIFTNTEEEDNYPHISTASCHGCHILPFKWFLLFPFWKSQLTTKMHLFIMSPFLPHILYFFQSVRNCS